MPWDDVLQQIEPDDHVTAEVGPWAEEKHRLLAHYASLFVRSMQGKWDDLVYLDLFAGPGQCKIRNTSRYYRSSPTIIVGLEETFSFYVFCDSKSENTDVLKVRIGNTASDRKVAVISGDANAYVGKILESVPIGDKTRRVLSFCFLDPYRLGNLKFETIRRLADRYMDFLVLIPSGMDAHRNVQIYTEKENSVLDEFLGNKTWRERWLDLKEKKVPFEQFVVAEFGRSMSELDYIDPGLENVATIRSQEKNLLLYRLALYSRHELGAKFWKETQKYTNPQSGWDF